jgi:hypothetical protein
MKSTKLIVMNSLVVGLALIFGTGCGDKDKAGQAAAYQAAVDSAKQGQVDVARIKDCVSKSASADEAKKCQ